VGRAIAAAAPLRHPSAPPEPPARGRARARHAGGAAARGAARDGGLGGLRAGSGVADNRIGASTRLAVVDAIVSGTHEPGTSHHALLAAFVSAKTLARVDAELEAGGYRTHEFGDSVLIERAAVRCGRDAAVARRWA